MTDNLTEIKSLKNVFCPGDILYGKLRPNLNKVWFSDRKGICSTDIFVVRSLDERVLPALYAYIFRSGHFNKVVLSELKGAQLPRIGWLSFENLKIPLPPLEVQRENLAEIEGYQKVIDGARAVINNYRPRIPIDPEWPMAELGDTVEILDSLRRPITKHERKPGPYPYYGATGTLDYVESYIFDEPLVLVGEDGAKWGPGEQSAYAVDGKVWVNNHAHVLRPKRGRLLDGFLIEIMKFFGLKAIYYWRHGSQTDQAKLKNIRIPLPPIEVQKEIVAEIEAEQSFVKANRELLNHFEKKIQATIARMWGTKDSEHTLP